MAGKRVTKHGNWFELLKKTMDLGQRISFTCKKAESKKIKLATFKGQLDCLNDYVECMEELEDEKKTLE
jgi:hypothetical protein